MDGLFYKKIATYPMIVEIRSNEDRRIVFENIYKMLSAVFYNNNLIKGYKFNLFVNSEKLKKVNVFESILGNFECNDYPSFEASDKPNSYNILVEVYTKDQAPSLSEAHMIYFNTYIIDIISQVTRMYIVDCDIFINDTLYTYGSTTVLDDLKLIDVWDDLSIFMHGFNIFMLLVYNIISDRRNIPRLQVYNEDIFDRFKIEDKDVLDSLNKEFKNMTKEELLEIYTLAFFEFMNLMNTPIYKHVIKCASIGYWKRNDDEPDIVFVFIIIGSLLSEISKFKK